MFATANDISTNADNGQNSSNSLLTFVPSGNSSLLPAPPGPYGNINPFMQTPIQAGPPQSIFNNNGKTSPSSSYGSKKRP
jgi:hypothetical protein